MEIIEAKKEHFEAIKDLLVELQEYVIEIDKYKLNILSPKYREQYFKKTYKETYKNGGKIFVAIQDGVVVGMIAGHLRVYDDNDKLDFTCPKMGVVEELIVSKTSRKGGVGNLLLTTMENYFKSIGCEYIKIGVFAYNENAKQFYAKHDYENRFVDMFKAIK